jgi:urease accessory protein
MSRPAHQASRTTGTIASSECRWHAALELCFRRSGNRTRLVASRHHGPLCVQRPFYPEQGGSCHVVLLHPPGGIVGGDVLEIDVSLEEEAEVLFTTPAAAKFYRSGGPWGRQRQTLRARAGSRLEWLPQETIVFDGALAEIATRVELEGDARFAGWEILCLGRTASGERLHGGEVRQRFEVWRDGKPLRIERSQLNAGSPVMDEGWGLAGRPVLGSFTVTADESRDDIRRLVSRVRRALPELPNGDLASITALEGVLVCRYLGASTETARGCFERAWGVLRPALLGAAAHPPRIWAT